MNEMAIKKVDIILSNKEHKEFFHWTKKLPRKLKKRLRRMVIEEESILKLLEIYEEPQFRITLYKDSAIHEKLKNCDLPFLSDYAKRAAPYDFPVFIWWG